MKTKKDKNNKVFLFLKNNDLNWVPPSNQTATMRNTINEKIRKLGHKYYQVKELFEKLKLNRDYIFDVGKKLVEEYKNIKKGINLQSQQKRMKEGLIVWYTEYFYNEIFASDSTFLKNFFGQNEISLCQALTHSSLQRINTNANSQASSNQNKKINSNEHQTQIFYTDTVFNKEIDNFDFSNVEKDKNNESPSNKSGNFDFESLLLFK